MWLSKDEGGCEITHGTAVYRFLVAGEPVEVPDDLGGHLLALGGYRYAEPPAPPQQPESEAPRPAGRSRGKDPAGPAA